MLQGESHVSHDPILSLGNSICSRSRFAERSHKSKKKTHNSSSYCELGPPVANIMPITMLYFKLSLMLMFDVYNNTAPHNISHLFTSTQQIPSYSTRSSSSGNYYISHSRLNQKNDLFSIGEPKFGMAYLKIYEIHQNLSLKKFMQFC